MLNDWREFCFLTGSIFFDKSLCLPKPGSNWSTGELALQIHLKVTHGDFNYHMFSWDQDYMPTIKSGSSLPTYEDFVTLLDDSSLVQIVSEPTSGENILGYFLTSKPTLVNKVEIHPVIADHDMVPLKCKNQTP